MKRKIVGNTNILTRAANTRRLRFMPGLLSEWLKKRIGTEHGDTARFAREVREKTGVVLRPDELSDFQAGARITQQKLKKLVAAFADDRSAQAALVSQYMFDQVPSEFRRFVEIRDRVVGSGREIKPELDEFDRTLADVAAMKSNPVVESAVKSLRVTVDEIRKLMQRTK